MCGWRGWRRLRKAAVEIKETIRDSWRGWRDSRVRANVALSCSVDNDPGLRPVSLAALSSLGYEVERIDVWINPELF